MKVDFISIPIAIRETGDCFNCIARLRDDILRLKGIKRVEEIDNPSKLLVEYDPNLTSLEVIESYVTRQGLKLKSHYGHQHYNIEGLDCLDCALKLEQSISKIPGVTWVSLNYATSKIWFEYEPEEVTHNYILSAIKKTGYQYSEPEVSSVNTYTTTSSFVRSCVTAHLMSTIFFWPTPHTVTCSRKNTAHSSKKSVLQARSSYWTGWI